jgi:hypothetical protein
MRGPSFKPLKQALIALLLETQFSQKQIASAK